MDNDIQKEVSKFSKNKYTYLLDVINTVESKPEITEDTRNSTQYNDVLQKIEKLKNTGSRGSMHPYPWEDKDYKPSDKLPSSVEPDKKYVKKTYYVGNNLSDSNTTETIEYSVGVDTTPLQPNLTVRGKHGTFKSSKTNKNAPLIFIVGGLTWPKTQASDKDIGNQKGQSRYPGDKKDNVDGYVWVYGFNKLYDFNIYNCFTHRDGKDGWNECLGLLQQHSIIPEKYILVAFSAGANIIHDDVLPIADVSFWDIIHIVGPSSGALARTNVFVTSAGDKTYYIQQGGIDVRSEGADPKDKKQFSELLNSSKQTLTSRDHTDGLQVSANWIKDNIKVVKGVKAEKNTKRIIIRPNKSARIGGKYKGGRTLIYKGKSPTAGTIQQYYNMPPPAPPADPAKAAREISIIMNDVGYKKYWKNKIMKNGNGNAADWLNKVYNEAYAIGMSFRDLLFVICLESSFDPNNYNSGSGAAGLLQWQGTRKKVFPKGEPRLLNAYQQLPYITKYYKGRPGYKTQGVPNLTAAYTYVIGGNTTNPNEVIYSRAKNPSEYLQNDNLDFNRDGIILAGEAAECCVWKWYTGSTTPDPGEKWPKPNLYQNYPIIK
jgi:hypothetical protein